MKTILIVLAANYLGFSLATPLGLRDPTDVGLTAPEMIVKHGYPCETHFLTTSDGYILQLHRIPYGIDGPGATDRQPVLIMHGLISSSAEFVNMGPGWSLGYTLADLGYDVWLGNVRGNIYSRNHTTYDPDVDKAEFWNFSFHEIGVVDIAESIDYVLINNGAQSLYYIGHSQGTTVFFVMAAMRPEYHQKVRIASLMAPAAYLEHNSNSFYQSLLPYLDQIEDVLNAGGIVEFPFLDMVRTWGQENCGNPEFINACLDIMGGLSDPTQIDTAMLPVIATNAPAGASTKQYYHFGQQIRAGGFSLYDYGPEENLILYGSEVPPPYNLSTIEIPIAVYYGLNDGTTNFTDVENVVRDLPNCVNSYLVPYDLFNHIDFVFAKDVGTLVYNELIRVMQEY